MMPINKPSPRRPGVGCFQGTPLRPVEVTPGKNPGHFFSPSLYYNKETATPPRIKTVIITDKQGNPIDLPPPANTFKPVASRDERLAQSHAFKGYSSPSFQFCQQVFPSAASPSMMSEQTAETMTVTSRSTTPYSCASPSPTRFLNTSYCYDSQSSTPTIRASPAKRRSQFNSSPSVEDSARKQRIKTELCTHYEAGKGCPFGERCTYAHGEKELQKTKLMDLQRAGLVEDVETYRTKPCFTWVSTG